MYATILVKTNFKLFKEALFKELSNALMIRENSLKWTMAFFN